MAPLSMLLLPFKILPYGSTHYVVDSSPNVALPNPVIIQKIIRPLVTVQNTLPPNPLKSSWSAQYMPSSSASGNNKIPLYMMILLDSTLSKWTIEYSTYTLTSIIISHCLTPSCYTPTTHPKISASHPRSSSSSLLRFTLPLNIANSNYYNTKNNWFDLSGSLYFEMIQKRF